LVTISKGPFETEAEADAWIEGLYRSYHPAGYGTHAVVEERSDGWWARGSRASSCD
jgi:hypothetical protein